MTHLKDSIAFAEKSIEWNNTQLKFINGLLHDGTKRDTKFWGKQVRWHMTDRAMWIKQLSKLRKSEATEK